VNLKQPGLLYAKLQVEPAVTENPIKKLKNEKERIIYAP